MRRGGTAWLRLPRFSARSRSGRGDCFWSDRYDHHIEVVGDMASGDREIVRPGSHPTVFRLGGDRLVGRGCRRRNSRASGTRADRAPRAGDRRTAAHTSMYDRQRAGSAYCTGQVPPGPMTGKFSTPHQRSRTPSHRSFASSTKPSAMISSPQTLPGTGHGEASERTRTFSLTTPRPAPMRSLT